MQGDMNTVLSPILFINTSVAMFFHDFLIAASLNFTSAEKQTRVGKWVAGMW